MIGSLPKVSDQWLVVSNQQSAVTPLLSANYSIVPLYQSSHDLVYYFG